MNVLQHRAYAAIERITKARTAEEKQLARQDGLAVKSDLEKFLAEENALRAFKAARPRSAVGMYKDTTRFVFMVPASGKTQTAAVELPDGTKVVPVQNQIAVPSKMVNAMIAGGWVRANDVITELDVVLRDPALPQE
jgi:hypothetical protein